MKDKVKNVMLDVPEGWLYGFPKVVPITITTQEIRELLVRSKYPKKDIEFALMYMRYNPITEE